MSVIPGEVGIEWRFVSVYYGGGGWLSQSWFRRSLFIHSFINACRWKLVRSDPGARKYRAPVSFRVPARKCKACRGCLAGNTTNLLGFLSRTVNPFGTTHPFIYLAALAMEESASELLPDLKDLENKVGRKTPEGLLRWLREDTARLAGEKVDTAGASGDQAALFPGQNKRLPQGLAEKIRVLRLEMAYLRTIDIKIMHQLMAVNEGIEAVKWILEEKGTLASRCSSLTSSMYSLVESQETSRRGSWNSLQDPNDKLDGISIGSFLDTLADDMDEYCQTSTDPLSSTPSNHGGSFTTMEKEIYTNEMHYQQTNLANGFSEKEGKNASDCNVESKFCHDKPCKDIGKLKIQKNGKIDHDGCKRNKMHIEYDAHWHWVQSQDDVTFL